MTKPPFYRRRPLISMLIFILVLSASLLFVALQRLDIGSYRQQLASRLEQALHKKVRLGDAKLSFDGGIALVAHNLQIGDDDDFSLHVPKLSASLKPLYLLFGEIVIEQVLLEAPNLKLSLPLMLAKSALNLDRLGLKTLQIRNAGLTAYPAGHPETPFRTDNLNLVVHGLGRGLVSKLAATATLSQPDRNAELNLFLELTRQRQGQPWRQGQLQGSVTLHGLQHNFLKNRISPKLPGHFDLNIGLQGIPADKVLFEAKVNDSNNNKPLFHLASEWQSTPTVDSLHNLRLDLDGAPLTGQLQLNRQGDEPQLTGRIELNNSELKNLLARAKALDKLSGQVEKLSITLNGPLHATSDNPFAPIKAAFLRLKGLSYPLGQSELTDVGMVLELQNTHLSLTQGQGLFAHTPFTFSGASDLQGHATPEFDFALNGTADLEQLQAEFPSPFLQRQKLIGQAPIDLDLHGPLDHLAANFKIDLSKTDLHIGTLLKKNPDTPCHIELNGHIEPKRITIDKARLNIAQASVALSGEWARKQNQWSGRLQLVPLRLETLQPISPIFSLFKISGETEGHLTQEGINGWTGQFSLSQGGAHLTQVLADLNQVNGVLLLDEDGFDLGDVQARLGESPISVSGGLSNWRSPLLSLHVKSKELRAQDLIFTNQEMMLQNLDGQLLISAGGITFDQIQVTVANETTAKIEGLMRGYRKPHTYLEISSNRADLKDVIRLFSGPPRFPHSPTKQNKASLEIKTRVKQGSLGSFSFEDAEGTITDRNQVLSITPLTFNLGKGSASGRVEIDRLRNNLLKISGQVQNSDADSVYEMLFEKKGIFRGTLSGDFYIEGEGIGEQFWKTSQGGGHLKIRDGVMRELNGFAQIFSLLNVSQLFTFKLPDMDKEGLPLSLLETSARITDGILHFDDFRIISPAINISAVGQIDSLQQTIDSTLGIKPLRTVDIILSRVPLFGWVLTGDEEALITALFTLKGPLANPKVSAAPVSSIANTALGIIGRTLGLPFRMLQKTGEFLTTPPRPDETPLSRRKETQN